MENEGKLRLQRLTVMARTLGSEVGLRWMEKSGAPPSRPGTALRKSDKITLPGEEEAPPAPQAPMMGVPPTWQELTESVPMAATRTMLASGMDDRVRKQLMGGGARKEVVDPKDLPQDESLIPRLNAASTRWGLSNSTTEGTTMYSTVFEMLRYRVGGPI